MNKTVLNAHVWERDADDYYVEPEWCSERLFQVEHFGPSGIHDPACGSGRIVRSAVAAGLRAIGSDKVVRTRGDNFIIAPTDFMQMSRPLASSIVSNPPFGIADEFAERALRLTTYKVAFLLPVKWLSGDKRSRWLAHTPLKCVWFLTPRPSMPPGKLIEAGLKPGNGTKDFCWIVWQHGFRGQVHVRWLRTGDALGLVI